MTTFEHDKVINRIRKMINLGTNSGATEGERDNAMRMAKNLADKHGLDIAIAMASNDVETKRSAEAAEPREHDKLSGVLCTAWTRQVAHAVAKLFHCEYFYTRTAKYKGNHTFIGRHSNVVTAKEMTDYLINGIHREATKHQKDLCLNYPGYRNFAEGATSAVYRRVLDLLAKEARGETIVENGQTVDRSKALVLVNFNVNEQALNKRYLAEVMHINLGRGRGGGGGQRDDISRAAGAAYGNSVSLNRQVK